MRRSPVSLLVARGISMHRHLRLSEAIRLVFCRMRWSTERHWHYDEPERDSEGNRGRLGGPGPEAALRSGRIRCNPRPSEDRIGLKRRIVRLHYRYFGYECFVSIRRL
jgi:hypothetical protein